MPKNKILILGNTTRHTDEQCTAYAESLDMLNKGLLSGSVFDVSDDGCYHSTFGDVSIDDVKSLVENFDHVVFLKQPRDTYDEELYLQTKVALIYIKNVLGIEVQHYG